VNTTTKSVYCGIVITEPLDVTLIGNVATNAAGLPFESVPLVKIDALFAKANVNDGEAFPFDVVVVAVVLVVVVFVVVLFIGVHTNPAGHWTAVGLIGVHTNPTGQTTEVVGIVC
jgi:hypothetical protein